MKKDKKHFTFDKFINDIEKRESAAREKIESHQKGQEDHPARKYNRLYRELWQNRISVRRK